MSDTVIARTPEPPYYAVLFTRVRRDSGPGDDGYAEAARRMVELARGQPGFLGAESVAEASGAGITISYWTSLEAIAAWKAHAEHRVAQERGRSTWYLDYCVRVARVERAYGPMKTGGYSVETA